MLTKISDNHDTHLAKLHKASKPDFLQHHGHGQHHEHGQGRSNEETETRAGGRVDSRTETKAKGKIE